jgi:hypothetical protein
MCQRAKIEALKESKYGARESIRVEVVHNNNNNKLL